MALWNSDAELFRLMRDNLFTAVIGDILDEMGLLRQFAPRELRPLRDNMLVIGRAMTVLQQDLSEPGGGRPFGLLFEALDDLKPGEVYVAAGGSPSYAMWGELMSARARHLGAAGAVVEGCSRDTRAILALEFPVFSMGPYAQDQRPRGQVIDFRIPVQLGQVSVNSGDLVFGDLDGVLIVPRAAEVEALTRALEKVQKENAVRSAIEKGLSTSEAFARFGVM